LIEKIQFFYYRLSQSLYVGQISNSLVKFGAAWKAIQITFHGIVVLSSENLNSLEPICLYFTYFIFGHS